MLAYLLMAGDFDIPSNYQIGISADVTPNVTVSVDYKHIKYSDADFSEQSIQHSQLRIWVKQRPRFWLG